jgi:hypothetical protein
MIKTKRHLAQSLAAMLAVSVLSACGSSLQTAATGSDSNGSAAVPGNGAQDISNPESPISKLEYSGSVSGGTADGAMAFQLDKANKVLVVSVPLALAGLSLNLNMSHPQYPDILIYSYVDNDFMTHLAVRIPLKYILRGVNFGNSQKLPNGLPLPYIVDGELPSTSFVIDSIKNAKLNLYIGSSSVAVYVSHPIVPAYLGFTVPVKNQAKTKIVGAFSLVPKTGLADGGFYVATRIPDEIAKTLNDYIGL